MSRLASVFVLLLAIVPTVVSQSVPKELLSTPIRLELDKATKEVKAGTTVNYTVTLKNSRDQAVAASSNMPLQIETPSGPKNIVIPAGQSSATFTWQAVNAGVGRMVVHSGKLHPASGLVLVAPALRPTTVMMPVPHPGGGAGAGAGRGAERPPVFDHRRLGGIGGRAAGAGGQPVPPPPPAATPTPLPASALAKKIQLYVEPLPVYGNPVDHIWKANVSVAALGEQDSLVPVPSNVPVHFNASSGRLSSADIVLSAGQFSNFENPVVLTADRFGKGAVNAVSSLGSAGPVEIEFLQPPPTQLRLSLGSPVLAGTGSSTATVQACLLDESEAVTSSSQDVQVTLTAAPGQLQSSILTIHSGSSCSDSIVWTSASGAASIRAEAGGLKFDSKNITFPSFPWYFIALAAFGGLFGAIISRPKHLFSVSWWSHTWRSLVLGAVLGAIFYLFARFGAIALPKDSPISIQNIPVVSGIGALLLGFLGGLYGRKLWGIDDDKPKPEHPKPPMARHAQNHGGDD